MSIKMLTLYEKPISADWDLFVNACCERLGVCKGQEISLQNFINTKLTTSFAPLLIAYLSVGIKRCSFVVP